MGSSLEFDSSVCSLTRRAIGGIKVSLFNLEQLPPASISSPKDVAVLYILHGRESSNVFSESVAFSVQKIYQTTRTRTTLPLICLSFDMRNHGERIIDPERNKGWDDGNATHAMDMCSFIDGTVQDCRLLIDYLPLIYPGYNFRNFVTGTSMGGHVCYRVATELSRKIELIIPVIACTDICTLMVNRVKNIPVEESIKGVRKLAYEDLKLTDEQQKLWPEYLHNYISKQDYQVAENFPNHVKVFSVFGKQDRLVPPEYSEEWIQEMEKERCYDGSIEKYLFVEMGHESNNAMCKLYSAWLMGVITL